MLDKSVAHMLSTVASVYAVFVYSIAFALEMWFIFTSDLLDHNFYSSNSQSNFESSSSSSSSSSLSANANVWSSMPVAAFAFILAAIYFITLVVSLLLMLGIIVRSMVCLLVWLVTFGLLFFPECGLVLHLSLNVWRIDSRNGQIELCFYVVRAIMNVFFMICVQNLVCQWRTEKQVSNYVSNLNAFQGYPGLATVSGLNTLAADPSYFLDAGHSSLLSVNSPTFKCNTLGRFNALSSVNGPINSFGLPRTGSIKHNPLTSYANSYVANPISEFDARNFHDFMLRKNVFFDDMYSDRIDCLQMDNKSPIKVQYSTQSLDRRRFLQQQFASPSSHPVRPQWPTTLPETQEHVTLRPLTTRPFDYLQRPGSMSALNTIGQTNDNSSSTTTTSTATATYANNQYYNNNNDDHKVNLNLQPPKSSSTSDLKKSLESTKQPINLRQTSDQNSSLHSIRDIAL